MYITAPGDEMVGLSDGHITVDLGFPVDPSDTEEVEEVRETFARVAKELFYTEPTVLFDFELGRE